MYESKLPLLLENLAKIYTVRLSEEVKRYQKFVLYIKDNYHRKNPNPASSNYKEIGKISPYTSPITTKIPYDN